MLTDVELIKKRKKELGWTNQILADRSGVPVGTVNKILSGTTVYPRPENLILLRKALQLRVEETGYCCSPEQNSNCIAETNIYQAKREIRKTTEDYYRLPKEARMELIDGMLYDMEVPSLTHQEIVVNLAFACKMYVKKANLKCKVYVAPCDVCLDTDDYTIVQPDVFMVCDPKKCENQIRMNGAPEVVMEVVSESNSKMDYFQKLQKYQNADVKEYWILDPLKKRVLVYSFWKDSLPEVYSFEEVIPSQYYPDLMIDMRQVYEHNN